MPAHKLDPHNMILRVLQNGIRQHQTRPGRDGIPHTIQDRVADMSDPAMVVIAREYQAGVPSRLRTDSSNGLGIDRREIERLRFRIRLRYMCILGNARQKSIGSIEGYPEP